MSSSPTPRPDEGLQHAVGFHGSDDELVGQIAGLVRDGRRRGDTVVLALPASTVAALERELGAVDGIIVLDRPGGPAGLCGQSLAVRWARTLEGLCRSGPVTVIGQHDSDHDGPDGRFWTDLDTAVHVALAHLPIRLVCFYPRMPLHRVVLDGASWLHPLVYADGALRPNPEHRPVRDVLTDIGAPAPELLGAPHHELELGTGALSRIRTLVEHVLRERDCPDDRLDDAILAINEVATNAVEHGRGPARLTLWAEPEGCVAEVHDRGELDDPFLGLVAPEPGQDRGRGLWVARQACDYLRVWRDDAGTHVRIHVTVRAPATC